MRRRPPILAPDFKLKLEPGRLRVPSSYGSFFRAPPPGGRPLAAAATAPFHVPTLVASNSAPPAASTSNENVNLRARARRSDDTGDRDVRLCSNLNLCQINFFFEYYIAGTGSPESGIAETQMHFRFKFPFGEGHCTV